MIRFTGWPISWRTWVGLTLILSTCSATSANFPSSREEQGSGRSSTNQSQPNPGSPGNGPPCIIYHQNIMSLTASCPSFAAPFRTSSIARARGQVGALLGQVESLRRLQVIIGLD